MYLYYKYGPCLVHIFCVLYMHRFVSHLCDPWVGALAVDAVVLEPLVLRVGAVLLEGAAVLSFAPNTPKQWVCLQTQTAASTLGVALVQMDYAGERKKTERDGKRKTRREGREEGNGRGRRCREVNNLCTNDYRNAKCM